jgi:lipoprotein-anchoring transpeptidase ErfK/SrfK
MQKKWFALALPLAALAPTAARAQEAPRDSGLILSSVPQALAQPVARMRDFSLLVDKSRRELYVLSGERVIRRFPVSVGQEGYDTPAGNFSIRHMVWNPDWRPPHSPWARDHHYEEPNSPGNPMGHVKMFFKDPDLYIHGTGLPSSLGQARSHGCIRMRDIDAVELAKIVMVNGGARQGKDFYDDVLGRPNVSHDVPLPTPVKVVVRE